MKNDRRKNWFKGKKEVAGNAFISTWNTVNTSAGSSSSNQIKLPLKIDGVYDFNVDWGDGSNSDITAWDQSEVTHTYASSGTYTITITGVINGFRFAQTGDRLKILDISQWGVVIVGDPSAGLTEGAFDVCSNLDITATDVPDFTGMTSLARMFVNCTSLVFNDSINNWDVSGITNMGFLFFGCSSFNKPLNSWNVSNVTSMAAMFRLATSFNQPLNNWNVGNVLAFGGNNLGMFMQATSFNQNLGSWNVSSGTNFISMFNSATNFNNGGSPDINNWVTSSSTNMSLMFNQASAFNQNIGGWIVGNVTVFTQMFRLATNFNNGGSSDINNWVMTSALNLSEMFLAAPAFNQPVGNWNVGSVTNFFRLFRAATAFNQNIGGWNVSNGTNFAEFMFGKTNLNYSAANLDAIYNGWSALTLVANRTIDFGTIKYTAAGQAGRDILTGSPNNWTITDGGI